MTRVIRARDKEPARTILRHLVVKSFDNCNHQCRHIRRWCTHVRFVRLAVLELNELVVEAQQGPPLIGAVRIGH